ncbi:MAG: hypothetical protein WCV81_05985 [Microgenomates group bacterium]|jgi:hypothetical protein
MDIQSDAPKITSSKVNKPIIFIPLIILILIGVFLYFNKQTSLFIDPNTIDLTKGRVIDLKDNFGFYIEQAPEVCDQSNLSKYFKSFVIPGKNGEATTSGAMSVYGETTWNYILQGEISKIETNSSGIKYTLVSGENKLITQSTNNTTTFLKNPTASPSSSLVPTKINASTFAIKDKVYLYYLVKCGGNKSPLLFLEYIQKITAKQTNTTATSSGYLKIMSDGLGNFYGQVKEKGENYLILGRGTQTIKIIIPNNVPINIVPKSILTSDADLAKPPTESISLSSVKIGDFVSVTGKYDGKLLTAAFIAVTK